MINDFTRSLFDQIGQVDRELEVKKELLKKHKEQILNSCLLTINLNCLEAMQLLIFKVFYKDVIQWDECRLLNEYSDALDKIKSEVDQEKTHIKFTTGIYETLSNRAFLNDLEHHDYRKFKSLNDWDNISLNLTRYQTQARNINKLVNALAFSDKDPNKFHATRRTEEGLRLIAHLYKNLTKEEIELYGEVDKGYRGLKSVIKDKIPRKKFLELFPGEFDFKNRWSKFIKMK